MTRFYHGSTSFGPIRWRPEVGRSDDADMMFFSRSANVARRYGSVVEVDIDLRGIERITALEWLSGRALPETFIICGDGSYDFPVDTLCLRHDPGVELRPVPDLDALDDGLAITHEPNSPDDRQFQAFINDFYDGDIAQWSREIQTGPC
ncbi:hypothetical protein [Marinobacter shengliensis]|uniref:hypothetical protein n=1 Tax=Marinobacter shengliensis TaxID=1389223 RepID=UPI001107A9DE|nr:hypothetical protein [Marinobacter shengliensis]